MLEGAGAQQQSPGAPGTGDDGTGPADSLIDLVARCLERVDSEGEEALDAFCREHPEEAPAVRERIEVLRRLGLASPPQERPIEFGRYQLQRELGRGGMGVVYLARDSQLGREVALKALGSRLAGSDRARSRFEREIRAIAHLKHPHIVPIYEVGESDGVPYFTMEYVEGRTLGAVLRSLRRLEVPTTELNTTHLGLATFFRETDGPEGPEAEDESDEFRPLGPPLAPGELPALPESWGKTYVETICRLTLEIAEALGHAHEHGVVHRDVKPSNILISREGRAQLFDFGLARLDSEDTLTLTGDFAGTPYYVSPEQARGREVDHRTDVYSLGVTLYELLTLRRPFEGRNAQAVFRQIQFKEPPLLRRVNRLVPRDLETVCLTALEKDPGRRYQSAYEFAADLRRFLEFRPVLARPAGLTTRTVRLLRRNPAAATAVFLAVLLVLGTITALAVHSRIVAAERDSTAQAALRAGHLFQFLRGMLASVDPDARGHDVTVRELLDEAALQVGRQFPSEPQVEAALRETIGNTYYELGHYVQAEEHLARALELFERELGPESPQVAGCLHTLARALHGQNRYEEARPLIEASLATWNALVPGDHGGKAVALSTLGAIEADQFEDFEEAERLFHEALAMRLRLYGEVHSGVADNLHQLGKLRALKKDPRGALELHQRALEIRVELSGEDHPTVATTLGNIASLKHRLGELDEAEELFRRVLAIRLEAMGEAHPEVARTLNNLANLRRRRGDFAEAEELARHALQISREFFEGDHLDLAGILTTIGQILQNQRRFTEAREFLEEAYAMNQRLLNPEHSDQGVAALLLAGVLHEQGELEEAARYYAEALALREKILPPDHVSLGEAYHLYGSLELARGDLDGAEELLGEGLRINRLYLGEGEAMVVMGRSSLMELARARGDYAAAEGYARGLIQDYCNLHWGQSFAASMMTDLASLLFLQEADAESEAIFREALALQRRILPPASAELSHTLALLAELLITNHRFAEAEPLLFEALTILRATRGLDHPSTLTAQAMYARCLSYTDRPDEAEPLLLDSWTRLHALQGPDAQNTRRAAQEALAFYQDWGLVEQYEELLAACGEGVGVD